MTVTVPRGVEAIALTPDGRTRALKAGTTTTVRATMPA
jgi:hypothetical protein